MAQNDVFKEIIFIADEQHEAPAFAWGISLAYLLALSVAELVTTYASLLVGMVLYSLVLIALMIQSSLFAQKRMHNFLVILSIVPLVRLLSITMPMENLDPVYWYLLVGFLLSVAVFIIARLTKSSRTKIGLRLKREQLPLQLLIGLTGLLIGLVEYMLLIPAPYPQELSWGNYLLMSLVLLVFVGLLQEIIFRGLLQNSTTEILGRFGIVYTALLFALLHMGFHSLWNMLFIFFVGLVFGIAAAWTRSLVGVSISHGLANISFLFIFPLLMASRPSEIVSPPAVLATATHTATETVQASPTRTLIPDSTQPLVLIPASGSTPTPLPPTEILPACGLHPNWVVYVTQPGDTIQSISLVYGIDPAELLFANCFESDHQLKIGQGLFVPFDLVFSPTPTARIIFPALNTPTITPTKKPTRKPPANPTSVPSQAISPSPAIPTSTSNPATPTQQALPTLAPTQKPPAPPPTPEN